MHFFSPKIIIPSILSLSMAQAYASDIDASVYVDKQQKLHLMWQGSNNEVSINTIIQIVGPESKEIETKKNYYRFDDLKAGKYSITIKQGDKISSYSADISESSLELESLAYIAPSIETLEEKSFDDSAYPEFALSFQPLDADDKPITGLKKKDFILSENEVEIDDYLFRAPSEGEVTKIADVVVVFDDTGSMGEEIEQLKNNVKLFAEKLVAKGVDARFRLISYKDDANDGWAWTSDVDVFKSNIASLQALGGNNWTEDGFEAIDIAADYKFRSGAQKVFLFITDAPSYEGTDEYGKPTPTKAEINQKLKDNGINLYAIAYSNDQYKGAGSITEESGGKWFPISADFTDVVNEVGNTVGGIYQVAWSALDTSADTLEIKLTHIDSSKEIVHTYTRNIAPRVFTFPPEIRVAGGDIEIKTKAIDADDLVDATLMYREHKDDGTVAVWKTVKSPDDLNAEPIFTIPGSDVTAAGLDYLVWFKDEKGAKGFSKTKVLTVGTSVVLPSFEVISHELNSNLDLIFILKFKDLSESANLKLYFQGSESGVFIGEAEKEIKEGSGDVAYEKLADGSYKVTLKKAALSTETGVIGVIKLTAKIGDIIIEGSGKEFDNPARVDLYIERNADTIILTNFNKMTGDTSGLQIAIEDMVKKAWNLDSNGIPQTGGIDYNMKPVVMDLANTAVLTNGDKNPFQIKIDGQSLENSSASVIIARLTSFAQTKFTQHLTNFDGMFLLLIGSHGVIPYGQAEDFIRAAQRGKDGWVEENDWFASNLSTSGSTISLANLYADRDDDGDGIDEDDANFASDAPYRDHFKTGRLVETASHIESLLTNYSSKEGYLLTNKNFRYIGGYDHNDEKNGFVIARWFRDNFTATGWNIDGLYDASGVNGEDITTLINGISSGIVSFEGHGNYNLINNSKWSIFGGYAPFYAGRVRLEGDVTELSSLKDSLILSNACHAGVNYISSLTDYNKNIFTDFPEAYVNNSGDITENRSLGVYIGNTSYGRYHSGGVGAGHQLVQRAVQQMTSNPYTKTVYNSFYNRANVSGTNASRSDLLARPQFYGISNYRIGPKPVASSRLKVARASVIPKDSDYKLSNLIKTNISLNSDELSIELLFNIENLINFDPKQGKLMILGIDDYDRYGRPEMSLEIPIPRGAVISAKSVTDQLTNNENYLEAIKTESCNTEKCFSDDLKTTDFSDLDRMEVTVIKNKLYIRFIPIQYKTTSKEALITSMLKMNIKLKTPEFIPDTDKDGMPDYWEDFYGLDPRDPTGKNGADADLDKDGKTNLQEYAEQTDPLVDNRLKDDTTAPEVPTELAAKAKENAVDISFLAPSDAAQVQFFYGTDKTKLIESSRRVTATDKTISINGLKDNTTYYIVARAYDASGNLSEPSSVISFKTPKGVGPDLPQEPVLKDKVLVVKNPTDSDFKGYHLYISDKSTMAGAVSTFKLANKGAESTIDVSKYFIEDKEIFVKLVAVDENNHEGKPSEVIKLKDGIINTPPEAVDDFLTLKENTTATSDDVLANDTDADGDTLTIIAFDAISKEGGTVVNNGDGTFTYTPKKDFKGQDSFTYTISDGKGGTAIGTVDIDVTGECFIATAAFGSYLAPDVKVLRHFRDDYLLTNELGKSFVEFYYENSPPIANYIAQRENLRAATRWALTPLIYSIKYPIGSLLFVLLLVAGWKNRRFWLKKRHTQV